MKGAVAFFALLLCIAAVAIACACAEITHWRFQRSGHALPCRDDQERAYAEGGMWLMHCLKRRGTTWLLRLTRAASFQTPPALFSWEQQVCFGYAEDALVLGWKPRAHVKLVKCGAEPDDLELCTLGSLQRLWRERERQPLHALTRDVVIRRRDALDFFRLPFRTRDELTVTFLTDDDDADEC